MANPIIDLRKLKEELRRRITPKNELSTVSLSNLSAPEEEPLLETEVPAHPEGFDDDPPPALLGWAAHEFDPASDSSLQFLIGGVLIAGGVVVTFFGNFLFALLLALAGGLVMAHAFRIPREMRFAVTGRGVEVGKRLYAFESIESFWIHYDPPLFKELVLKSKKAIMPHIKIPLDDLDPLQLRKTLLRFLPEEEQEISLIDVISKRLGF